MKLFQPKSCLVWTILVILVVSISIGGLIIAKPEIAFALQDVTHTTSVLYRLEAEIMLPTPYGRYYSEMFWKYNDEFYYILVDHPDQIGKWLFLLDLYIPHIEALLDGHGNEVTITAEQVTELLITLDEIASIGSPELRSDIQNEQDRLQLSDFVGMTMSQVLEHIENVWASDFPSEAIPSITITPVGTGTPIP